MPSPSGSTPVFGLPYPLETDQPDAATALEDLALAVEALQEKTQVPIGGTIEWWSDTLPTQGVWLFLHGASVSEGSYPALAAVYPGWVSGGNINLPDTRGLLTKGAASGGSGGPAVGSTGGAATVSLATGNIPQFNPTVSISDPGHEHPAYTAEVGPSDQFIYTMNTGVGNVLAIPLTGNAGGGAVLVGNGSSNHIQPASTGITGSITFGSSSPTPITVNPPYIAAHKIVRAA